MEFSDTWFSGYLAARLNRPGQIFVKEVARFARGSSRQTWFVTYDDAAIADEQKIVVRIDPPSGSTDPSPLRQEYLVYKQLGLTAVPIAETLWWEDDARWTDGRPFYLRRQVAGSWQIPHFLDADPAHDELKIEISKEHLRALALVHNVDWLALGFDRFLPAPSRREDCARNYVDWIQRQYEETRVEPILILLEACEWLCDNAPIAPRICLCKGTNGYGEEIFSNGRIVAMSDWEEVSIGDPAADFAFLQEMIPTIVRDGSTVWGMEQALAYYESVSGIRIDPASIGFYRYIRALKMVAFGHRAAVSVTDHPSANVRQAWTGTECIHIGKRILAAAIGMLPPLAPSRFQELLDTV
jgi:aminoglycoside phosphotransferase (APT) family kinase protein